MNTETNVIAAFQKFENNPIKTSVLGSILAMLVAGWTFMRPAIIEDLSADFVTKSEATELNSQVTKRLDTLEEELSLNKDAVNSLAIEVRVSAAFQMERSFKNDLAEHRREKIDDPGWRQAERNLQEKVILAERYRDCLLHNDINCDILQRQLLQ